MQNAVERQRRLGAFWHGVAFRLVAAISAALALALAVAAYAVWRQNALMSELDKLADQGLQRVLLIWEANENANDAARKMLILVTAPPEARAGAREEIEAANRRLDSALTLLGASLGPDPDHPRLQTVLDARRRYAAAFQSLADDVRQGDLDAARDRLVLATDFELSMLLSALETLDRSEQHELELAMGALRGRQRDDLFVYAAMLVVVLLAGGGLAVWIWRSAARPLRAAAVTAQAFAQGDYSQRLASTRQDEIGDLTRALDLLADEVSRREARLIDLVETDALTGLAERDRFLRLASAVLSGAASGVAIVVVDLDRLGTINQLLGFEGGDAAVQMVATHLRTVVGPAAPIGRIGGGRFALTLEIRGPATPAADLMAWAEELQQRLEQRSIWREQAVDLHLTVGVAAVQGESSDAALLLKRAERALQQAQQQSRPAAVWSQALEDVRPSYLSLLSDLQRACEQGQIVAFLQPRIDVRTGAVVGAEALVRWRHPIRGWLPPSEFVPFAESAGRIGLITGEMLRQGIDAARRLRDAGYAVQVAVNLSAHDLRDPTLAKRIADHLADAGLSPQLLQLEVTESSLVDAGDEPIRRLRDLRALGVDLAIDDFGTGQTAISQLHRWPMQTVKIDRQFVRGVDGLPPSRRALLEAIVQLAKSMGMETTAEGVETSGEMRVVQQAGCSSAQGWLIARAMAVDEFEAWLRQNPAAAATRLSDATAA